MKLRSVYFLLIYFVLIVSGCKRSEVKPELFDFNKMLELCVVKVKAAAINLTVFDSLPRSVEHGETKWHCVGVKDWCSGFWPGSLWYAYEASNDESLKDIATKFTMPLEIISKSKARDHDIGFMMYCSYGNAYRLTGNEAYKQVLLASADTLATLFNPNVGSIHSWPFRSQYPHNTIIDNMMNLELLYWASKNGDSSKLAAIANSHAELTMNNLVRTDGSAYHLGSFDNETGAFIRGFTYQGYADESMWARGQSWGIYGFAIAHRESGREDFLQTSMKMADKFLVRLPKDGIPFWDFDDPKIPNTPKDASAAAIAACGMFELSTLIKDPVISKKYFNEAVKLITLLSTPKYLSSETVAILKHSVGHMPKNSEIDVPIIYADYYYMEALLRLKKLSAQFN